MRLNSKFIEMAKATTLESQFSPAELAAFRNPRELHSSPSDDPDLRLSLRLFISSLDHHQSQKAFSETRMDIQERFPESKVLSYDQAKRRVSDLSGLVAWKHHMCPNSCIGFTGPFKLLERCPHCGEHRMISNSLWC
jgi:hypothetical protein